MHSTINPRLADDPHDVLVVASDAVLMAPTDDEISRLARSVPRSVDPQVRTVPDVTAGATVLPVAVPPVDTTFRPAATGDVRLPGRRRTAGGRAARAFTVALLLAVGSGAAAMAWQSYGGAAQRMIARWTSQLAQPAPTAVAAIAAPPSSGSPVQATPDAIAPAAVAPGPSVEAAPSPGVVTSDIASMRQEIGQLKASVDELRAGQQQISRDVAKATEARTSEARTSEVRTSGLKTSERNLRPKLPAHPSLAAARLRKPVPPPPLPPRQTAAYPALPPPATPYMPRQVESPPPPGAEPLADPELASVPRPPMPLR